MLTVEEKNRILVTAEDMGTISRIDADRELKRSIGRELKRSYADLFMLSLAISVISLALVIFILARDRIMMALLVGVFMLAPFVVVIDYYNKRGSIDKGEFICYLGSVDTVVKRNKKYLVTGLDLEEPISLSRICKNPPKEGEQVTIVQLRDEIFIIK